MKLITEEVLQEEVQYLIEENGPGPKNYYIEGVFLQANKLNRNNRIYPKELLQREVQRYTQNYINNDRALGELGHPETPVVNLDRASHKILSLRENGDDFIGKAKIMDTPYGKIAKNLMDEGVKLGVSSRGMGTLKSQGGSDMVQNDFVLCSAADIVHDPSAPGAFVRGIMEGKEWFQNGTGEWEERARKAIHEAHKIDREDTVLRLFEELMNKISS